jgi:hypothetical protein
VYLQMPEGTAVAWGSGATEWVMVKMCDQVYVVPIVFNTEGKGSVTLKIVPAPEVKDTWQWPPLDS